MGIILFLHCRSKATLTSMQHMLSMQVPSQSQVKFPATMSGGVHHQFSVQWPMLLQARYHELIVQWSVVLRALYHQFSVQWPMLLQALYHLFSVQFPMLL